MVGACQVSDGGSVRAFAANLIDTKNVRQIRDDARCRRCRFTHDLLRIRSMCTPRRLVMYRPPTCDILHPPLSCTYRTAPHPPPLYIPPPTDSARVVNRRTKAGTDRHQMASHSADQHIAHSQHCTSHHHKHNNISSLPNGARQYAGSYRRKRQCSSGEALQDARTNYQMRVTGSGAVPRSPYALLPSPSLPTYLTGP